MCMQLTRSLLVALAALPLCACNGGEGETPAPTEQAEAPAAPVFGGEQAAAPAGGETAGSAPVATPAPTLPSSDVPFDDTSPEAAMTTYMNRLAAGDLLGAVEICIPGAVGATELEARAAALVEASSETGMDPGVLVGFLVEGIGEATRQESSRDDDRVVYLVTVGNKPAREVAVIRTPDGWRVEPPDSGLPNA